MISDYLQEYAKLADWYISNYPNEEFSLSFKYNKDEHRIEFSYSIDVEGDRYSVANYIKDNVYLDKDFYNKMRNGIIPYAQRAIKEVIERIKCKEISGL